MKAANELTIKKKNLKEQILKLLKEFVNRHGRCNVKITTHAAKREDTFGDHKVDIDIEI